MAETRVNIRASAEDKERWEKAAKDQGLSFSDFVREALDFKASLGTLFRKGVRHFSEALGVNESVLVQNLILEQWALESAKEKVFGPTARVFEEFPLTEEGPITDRAFFDMRETQHIRDLEHKKLLQLVDELQRSGRLSDEDQAWLDQHSTPAAPVTRQRPAGIKRGGTRWLDDGEWKATADRIKKQSEED